MPANPKSLNDLLSIPDMYQKTPQPSQSHTKRTTSARAGITDFVWSWGNITPLYSALSEFQKEQGYTCLLYTSPSPRDRTRSRMPSSA